MVQFDGDYPTSVLKLAEVMSVGLENILGMHLFDLCGFSFGSIVGAYVALAAGTRLKSFSWWVHQPSDDRGMA